MTTTEKTKVFQHYDGQWHAETVVNVNGQQWQVSSCKSYSGSLKTTATKVDASASGTGYSVISFSSADMFNRIELLSEKVARVTQKATTVHHAKALTIFNAKIEAGEISTEKPVKPEIGTILFVDSLYENKHSSGNNWIVYDITQTGYRCVERDTLELRTKDYVKPYSEKFGIGTYFEPDFKFEGTADDLANLVLQAQEKAQQEAIKEQEAAEAAKAEWLQKIEKGKAIIGKLPDDISNIIVADKYQNDSDGMTDYYSTSVNRRVYLAFSSSSRNNFAELQRAAALFEETKEFAQQTEPQRNEGGYYLPSYYLGDKNWYGWKVRKDRMYQEREKAEELLYIAAAEGNYLVQTEPERKQAEPVSLENLNVLIVDYSEKALAVFGDTKEIKDQLKCLGGRFNGALRHEGTKRAGWIFQKSKRDDLEKLLTV